MILRRAGLIGALRVPALLVVGAALACAVPAVVSADSFTPVRMTVHVPAVARLDRPLVVRVTVTADPGVLDIRQGPVRAQVTLTRGECGAVFAHATGVVLLNRVLRPQPAPGRAYSGSARGGHRPGGYGEQTICAYLDDDYEQFATNTNQINVKVSRPCTATADRFDSFRRHHRRGLGARGRALRASARRACGPGVQL